MSYADTMLPEFDHEMANTRKVLERIPDDKFDWKPHPKSNTIGWNASHVADLPNWLFVTLKTPSLDIAPVGGEPYQFPKLTSRQEILDHFDRNVVPARQALATIKDEEIAKLRNLYSWQRLCQPSPPRRKTRSYTSATPGSGNGKTLSEWELFGPPRRHFWDLGVDCY